MKGGAFTCLVILLTICLAIAAVSKGKCQRCMRMEECPVFAVKSREEQRKIMEEFPCGTPPPTSDVLGFSSVAKGDQVCCPDINVWGVESSNKQDKVTETAYDRYATNRRDFNPIRPNDKIYDDEVDITDKNRGNNGGDSYEQTRMANRRRPLQRNWLNAPLMTRPNNFPQQQQRITGVDPYIRDQNFDNRRKPNPARPSEATNWNGPNSNLPGFTGSGPSSIFNNPQNNFNQESFNNPNNNNFFGNINSGNGNFNRRYFGGQCSAISSIPPSPETGCCGIDVSYRNPFPGGKNGFRARPVRPRDQNFWTPPVEYPKSNDPWTNRRRFLRAATNTDMVNVTLDNRIAGGKETQLEQFPWTVLLETTFDYGDKLSTFNCGGSIISARYVLTAAHCVVDENAKVNDVKVTLAEYDKRTFPQDCVRVPGEGRKCIQNIVIHAEDVVAHREFDDRRLRNDIALIRLQENAPYTDFIRPICLPPIDIDNPDYSDLRLAVAGWGRNGQYTSQVKQSTVLHLVPQKECSRSYPQLTRQHLCATGHSGEDTCKGDSGGPLMMLYEGKYYVSGVVSGKRADTPCGTPSTPSLYTNVYHYVNWIKSHIRN